MLDPNRLLVAAVFSLCACTTWVNRAPDDAIEAAGDERSVERIPEAEPPRDAPIEPEPVSSTEVELDDAEPFEEVRSKLGARVYTGRKLIAEWAEWTRSDRLVIVEQMPGRPHYLRGALLDLDRGASMATFPASRHVAPQLGLAPITQSLDSKAPPDAVVHLDDGAIVHARAVLPDGRPALRPWVVSHEHAEFLWVLGEDADGRLHGGLWDDPRREDVTLDVALEMAPPEWIEDPDYVTRWHRALEVKVGVRVCETPIEGAKADWPCARTRLERDGTARCITRTAPDCEPWSPELDRVSISDGTEIAESDATWEVLVDSPFASRVLLSKRTVDGQRLALSTPDGVAELIEVPEGTSFSLHPHYRVVWPLDFAWKTSTLSRLVDVERRELYELPRIQVPLNGVGLGRRTFLALEDRDDGRLLYVDLDGPSLHVAADVSDCPAGSTLEPLSGLGTRLAIGCMDTERGRLRWSMVVDGAEGWVTRTPHRVEEVMPDGRILVSNRRGLGEAFASWFSWLDVQPT